MMGSPPATRCIGLAVGISLAVLPAVSYAASSGDATGEGDTGRRVLDPVVQHTNRGVALMGRYDYAAAVRPFEEAYQIAPSSIRIRVNLAIALYNRNAKGDLERAEALLDEVIREDPEHARALYFRAITHQYRGQDEEAIPLLERLVKLRPDDACSWYLLARSKTHLGRPAREDLQRAIKENPGLASAYYDLMRVAFQEGKEEEAQALQETFVQLRESPLCEMLIIPQYQQMGPLAVVEPMPRALRSSVAGGELTTGATQTFLRGLGVVAGKMDPNELASSFASGFAMGDVNGDGHVDVAIANPALPEIKLLLRGSGQSFVDVTERAGLSVSGRPRACSFGDYDNDNNVDLFVSCEGPNHLFRGNGDGTFEDVTSVTRTAGPAVITHSALFLDADHDSDLDIYVCNGSVPAGLRVHTTAVNQLLNNNGDGTFTDIAERGGVRCADSQSYMVASADMDRDRDTDLVVFNIDGAADVFFNDRLGRYHEGRITGETLRGRWGGTLQDFNGDARPDLLIHPGPGTPGGLLLSDAAGRLVRSEQFDGCLAAIRTWGEVQGTRVADIDLDGDLDIGLLGKTGHLLLNDGQGHFVSRPNFWSEPALERVVAVELADLTGDGVPDLLCLSNKDGGSLTITSTGLKPPANWVSITPTGDRGDDGRTRSPTSGFGTRMEVRCGLHSQTITYTGVAGGLSQSQVPVPFGLNGVPKVDYLRLVWPDGVTQCEMDLSSRAHHRIQEMERRVSSCPVLFAWDGKHFGFIGDFAGVGGLGYYVAPGEYAQPQARELVRIAPDKLKAKEGVYELRICEPMEEVAYIDRLELIAVDHPREVDVYPDERLAITGPPPTQELLCPADPVFPVRAFGPHGEIDVDRLKQTDRRYAYQPKLDRPYLGFCEEHSLVLDFGDRLQKLDPNRDVYLFLTGWIEYPYSQTTYAAAQAGVHWQPMKIERLSAEGEWETIVEDAGAPGGMSRTIAVDLTDKLPLLGLLGRESFPLLGRESSLAPEEPDEPGAQGANSLPRREGTLGPAAACKLQITTNLEIYIDQAFIAADSGMEGFTFHTLPPAGAHLHRLGFPLEFSPDGQHPTVYTYDVIEPTSSFKMPSGAYTRYGPVEELLHEFDDEYVILGTGDEIAIKFDARTLPSLLEGQVRTFILVSHAYCKDMDLYTANPDTVEPLPSKSMSRYPYSKEEAERGVETHPLWGAVYHKRIVR
jgi:Flp pilus assembly protein TadD